MGRLAVELKSEKREPMNFFLKMIKFIRFWFFTLLLFGAGSALAGMFLILYMASDLPRLPSPLSRIIETPQTQIFASSGQVLRTLGERKSIPLNMVSSHFIHAILAIEDHRFFEHKGINKLRTIKGLYLTLIKGRVQGASTITQQLAKNLFFSFERTYKRKIKELLVALQMEASNTKSDILHAYINQIYFGAGAQGVEKAARTFFGKSALDLTLPEAALLAGLPKSPTSYNPFRHFDRAIERRNIVLQQMVRTGYISQEQAARATETHPVFDHQSADSRTGSYFLDALISELVSQYGENVVYHGGIKVYTTLDVRLQSFAESAVANGLNRLDQMMGLTDNDPEHPQAALVAVDSGSGAVKAMVGGKKYSVSEYNRAMKSRRQPGSGFKPFLYYAALESLGVHPATVMTDQPVSIPIKGAADWMPGNFERIYRGDMILKQALIHSVNTVAAQLVQQTGPAAVNRIARACGIKSSLKDVYSIALGTSGVTPYEMAAAYSVFSTLGIKHTPFMVWRVEDAFGRIVFEQIIQEKRVLDETTAYQLVDMMKSVLDVGSGRSIRASGFERPAAGKTGTTDSYNDAWFTGFTPTLSVSVWTGFDKEKKLVDQHSNGITGGRSAAPIWAEFMSHALKSSPVRDFSIPDDIRFVTVNPFTGCLITTTDAPDEQLKVALKMNQQPCEKGAQ
jgi:1A family penicillin-binding protein